MSWKFIDLETTTSTNDEAIKQTVPCVISAKKQTAGRGRRGRSWVECEGNLFASIVLEATIADLWKIICTTAVSLVETIGDAKIKWPNDILLNQKKVCGVLIEAGQEGFFVIGFGVNIQSSPKIADIIYPATSLKDEGIITDRLGFLHQYVSAFDKNWQDDKIYSKYQDYLYGIGQAVTINDKKGIMVGVDNSGCLLLQQDDRIEKIYTGDLFI